MNLFDLLLTFAKEYRNETRGKAGSKGLLFDVCLSCFLFSEFCLFVLFTFPQIRFYRIDSYGVNVNIVSRQLIARATY